MDRADLGRSNVPAPPATARALQQPRPGYKEISYGQEQNTTDATRGSSLRVRVEARKQELEQALAKFGPDDRARVDIEQALNEITGLLTGNLDQIPRVVAEELSVWLEANKHINEWHPGKKEHRRKEHAGKTAAAVKH